jgi:hypothetical protein
MVGPKQWRRGLKFGTWNVRSQYRSRSLTTAEGISKLCIIFIGYRGGQVGQREHCKSGNYIFFYGRGKNHQLGIGYFVVHREETAVKRVEFVGDSM